MEKGFIEQIAFSSERIRQELTPEIMGAKSDKCDVMVVCHAKIVWLSEWDLNSSVEATLIEKGAEPLSCTSPEGSTALS